jgi:formylglycine-generating enzyme required for sulfatase activity
MGSDRHYPEEAPVHRVAVEGFLIDRTPVTNRQFKNFVRATGRVTFGARSADHARQASAGVAPGSGCEFQIQTESMAAGCTDLSKV